MEYQIYWLSDAGTCFATSSDEQEFMLLFKFARSHGYSCITRKTYYGKLIAQKIFDDEEQALKHCGDGCLDSLKESISEFEMPS